MAVIHCLILWFPNSLSFTQHPSLFPVSLFRSLKATYSLCIRRLPIIRSIHQSSALNQVRCIHFVQNLCNSINCEKRAFSRNAIAMSSDETKSTTDLKDVAAGSSTDVVQDSTKVVAAVRNVQTQHGDYRSVDEENIVVLRNCLSPVPTRVAKTDGDNDNQMEAEAENEPDDEQVVWIEPFSEVRLFFSVYFATMYINSLWVQYQPNLCNGYKTPYISFVAFKIHFSGFKSIS